MGEPVTDDEENATDGENDEPGDYFGDISRATSNDETADGESPHFYDLDPGESPSVAVVSAVATSTGRPTTSLEPLSRTIDTDALNALVAHADSRAVSVTFDYAGTTVTVDATGRVVVYR